MIKWAMICTVVAFFIGWFTLIATWNESVRRERKALMEASREKLGPPKITISNIERVFYHDRGRYSFLVRQDDGTLRTVKILNPKTGYSISANPSIIDDVSSCGIMKAEWWGDENFTWRYEIHIKSISCIEGGDYDNGKFGKEHTSVLR